MYAHAVESCNGKISPDAQRARKVRGLTHLNLDILECCFIGSVYY
jgi:hypothetical protein